MIPTSIDGTDITGATIDGTDVQEITVDGDTVFSAGPTLPVAFSDLIAWYPFDSAEYGGANADDVTAIIGGSGDDTAYDGNVSGAQFRASDGVTDINAGASSGAFEFTNDEIVTGLDSDVTDGLSSMCMTIWANPNSVQTQQFGCIFQSFNAQFNFKIEPSTIENQLATDAGFQGIHSESFNQSTSYHFFAVNFDPGNGFREMFADDGTSVNRIGSQDSIAGNVIQKESGSTIPFRIGSANQSGSPDNDAKFDDVRIYKRALSNQELNQIYTNTQR